MSMGNVYGPSHMLENVEDLLSEAGDHGYVIQYVM